MTGMLSRRSFTRMAVLSALSPRLSHACGMAMMKSETLNPASSRFSVMLWTLNAGRNFEQRLEVVAQAGYTHVELVDEYLHWSDEEFARNFQRITALGLTVDAMAGLKTGFADPQHGAAFLAELGALIPLARRFGSPQIILLSGNRVNTVLPARQHDVALETLRQAADLLRKEDLVGVIEPIDRLENPAIYLDGVTEAFTLTRSIASSNLKVLYDLYHEQRSGGNLIEKLEENIAEVGLIHLADVPGRHEPGTGEMNVPNLLHTLDRLKYKGVIAMEFYPSGDAVEVLRRARIDAARNLQTPG